MLVNYIVMHVNCTYVLDMKMDCTYYIKPRIGNMKHQVLVIAMTRGIIKIKFSLTSKRYTKCVHIHLPAGEDFKSQW